MRYVKPPSRLLNQGEVPFDVMGLAAILCDIPRQAGRRMSALKSPQRCRGLFTMRCE